MERASLRTACVPVGCQTMRSNLEQHIIDKARPVVVLKRRLEACSACTLADG
jgi:hypothetical protein